jgi:hypothetical protein
MPCETPEIMRFDDCESGAAPYVKKEDIHQVEQSGTQVFAPLPKRSAAPGSPSERARSAEEKAFYERIQSAEGKAVYRKRGEVAELTNAHAKSRYGMTLLMLRGVKGALVMALLAALTKDVQVLVRARTARAQRAPITAVAIAT